MNNKLLKNFYNIICNLYANFLLIYEIIFLKNKKQIIDKNSFLLSRGFDIKKLSHIESLDINLNSEVEVNKYMSKYILMEDDIIRLIEKIFINSNLKQFISSKTGYNYSIDYLIAYKTLKIQYEEMDKGWYANHWHNDKPFSPNTLKVIMPIRPIASVSHGGLEIIDIKKSKVYDIDHKEVQPDYQMIANCDEVLIFYPNLCFHRAGSILEKNYTREQLMFQLNPSRHWKINNNLLKKQLKTEPKFPLFSYFFDQYRYLI